jgi:hypothetical protein
MPLPQKLYVSLDLLFCKFIGIVLASITANGPRRDGIEFIQPDIDELWVSISITCRCTPLGRYTSNDVCAAWRIVVEKRRDGAESRRRVLGMLEAESLTGEDFRGAHGKTKKK